MPEITGLTDDSAIELTDALIDIFVRNHVSVIATENHYYCAAYSNGHIEQMDWEDSTHDDEYILCDLCSDSFSDIESHIRAKHMNIIKIHLGV